MQVKNKNAGVFNRWLSTQEAICFCKSYGKNYSRQYMIQLGKSIHACEKKDGHYWQFNVDVLKDYFEASREIPLGYITLEKAAEMLGRKVITVYRYMAKGDLEHKKHFKKYIVLKKSVEKLKSQLTYKQRKDDEE